MALFSTSEQFIQTTKRLSAENEERAEEGKNKSIKLTQLADKIDHLLKECISYSVTVSEAKKANGVWEFMLTVTVLYRAKQKERETQIVEKSRSWTVNRHYNQFRYLYDQITDPNLKSWFNFPGRAIFNSDSVMKERFFSFSKLMEVIASDKELSKNPVCLQFLNPFDQFEMTSWL